MTTAQKSAAVLALVAIAGVTVYQAGIIRDRRAALAAPEPSLATVRKAERSPSAPAATTSAPPTAAPVVASPAVAPHSAEQRVDLLRQLLAELPAQGLPELKLLTPEEWLAIAQAHELDTPADIRVALADLRAVARKKFGEMLQAALRLFTDSSGGQLPIDPAHLLGYLPPSVDAAMLARYEMIRTGRLGDASEKILREKPTSDMILAVGIDGWGLNNNAALPAAFGETEADALDRVWRALGTALGSEAKERMAQLATPGMLSALFEESFKRLEPIYGDTDAFGETLKQAARNFAAAHPDEKLADIGQVLPFLKDSEKFVAAIRPTLAQLEYWNEHGGQSPPDAAALQSYLDRPFNPAEALRIMKLQWEGERLNLSYGYNWNGKP